MGYIKIETATSDNERVAFEIESEGLYKINCLSGLSIESLDKICEICIFHGIIVLQTEDRDLRNGFRAAPFLKDNRSESNIMAYDQRGNFLWNIGDIVGDIKMAFDCVSCVFKENAEKDLGIAISCETDILLECVAGGFIFIVDAINKKLLYKLSGRVK